MEAEWKKEFILNWCCSVNPSGSMLIIKLTNGEYPAKLCVEDKSLIINALISKLFILSPNAGNYDTL